MATHVIRGAKSTTVRSFFDEASAALQFPYYFGENWNAFNECLNDLDWIEADAYQIFISRSELLLRDADWEDWRILMKMFAIANRDWATPNQYSPRDRQPTPFHVVFQTDTEDGGRVTSALRELKYPSGWLQGQDYKISGVRNQQASGNMLLPCSTLLRSPTSLD